MNSITIHGRFTADPTLAVMLCDGRMLLKTAYASLYNLIGDTYSFSIAPTVGLTNTVNQTTTTSDCNWRCV